MPDVSSEQFAILLALENGDAEDRLSGERPHEPRGRMPGHLGPRANWLSSMQYYAFDFACNSAHFGAPARESVLKRNGK
jgi:hypothetical protein